MTTDGMLQIHRLRRGAPSQVPLVLLHGFPLDHRMWLDVVDLLPGDRTVLAPDLPGFGSSPTGPDIATGVGADPGTPSVDVMADAVAATLALAGVRQAVVAGLSMGGYVALALIERHPELVLGLGLVDSRSTADDEAGRARRLTMAQTVEAEMRVDAALGLRTSLLGAASRIGRPDLVERMEGWIRDQGPSAIAWAQRAMAARPDRTEALRRYPGPAVVVVGDEDEVTPVADGEHMAVALADAELVVVRGSGHMTTIESPEPVAAALTTLLGRSDHLA
jgi:pimeloyl-ACP methyl ester carboxylesterase